jgi:type IX secretion system PorP/SprF family membrane protein
MEEVKTQVNLHMGYSFKNIAPESVVRRSLVIIMIILVASLKAITLKAQDIHFSQFYSAPILTNPANTGMSGENLRVANNYRNQWATIGVPFETFCTSVDKKIAVLNHSFGVGGLVIHDQSSSYNLSGNEFMLSFSYSRFFNNQQVTIGLQPGIVYKSFNLKDLTFGTQFDQISGLFNSNLPTLESGLADRLHYFDLNFGISWSTLMQNYLPSAGICVSHVNMPVQKFSTSSSGTRMPWRISINGEVKVPFPNSINLTPCMLYSYTPGSAEFLIGSTGNYSLEKSVIQMKELYAVAMIRINPVRNIDALILGGGLRLMYFDIGLTYDLNISPLRKATNFNGAFEISLMFVGGRHARKSTYQPCYIIN